MIDVLMKREICRLRHTQREHYVSMKTDIGVRYPETKEHQRWSENH